VVERARIVLLAAEGMPGLEIAERVGCSEPTVVRWRSRFAERGLAGLADEPRSGKPPTIPRAVRDEILSITLTEPRTELGIKLWSSRLLTGRLRRDGKPVSHATVARVWKHFGIQPHRSGTFKFSTDGDCATDTRAARSAVAANRSIRALIWQLSTPDHRSCLADDQAQDPQDTP
jgi:transposase